jgi:hypothetical protein
VHHPGVLAGEPQAFFELRPSASANACRSTFMASLAMYVWEADSTADVPAFDGRNGSEVGPVYREIAFNDDSGDFGFVASRTRRSIQENMEVPKHPLPRVVSRANVAPGEATFGRWMKWGVGEENRRVVSPFWLSLVCWPLRRSRHTDLLSKTLPPLAELSSFVAVSTYFLE